jgi:ubiquinone biosynthesis protein UbiJ
VRLIAAEVAEKERFGSVHAPDVRLEGEAGLAQALAALGEQAFAAAWAEGRAITPEQAEADTFQDNDG